MLFFFFNDTATTEIYTLSLHDALPISGPSANAHELIVSFANNVTVGSVSVTSADGLATATQSDRKSTRLNSSHANISYAVFCLKKKKNNNRNTFSALVLRLHLA